MVQLEVEMGRYSSSGPSAHRCPPAGGSVQGIHLSLISGMRSTDNGVEKKE